MENWKGNTGQGPKRVGHSSQRCGIWERQEEAAISLSLAFKVRGLLAIGSNMKDPEERFWCQGIPVSVQGFWE